MWVGLDDQLIVDMHHDGAAPKRPHGIAENVAGGGLHDILHELRPVRIQPLPLLRGAGENRELLVPSHHSIMPVLFVGQYLGLFLFYLRLLSFLLILLLKQLMTGKCLKKSDIFLLFHVFIRFWRVSSNRERIV